MDEKYLLTTPMAQRLYFETAKQLPLIDYHNHLSAADIAAYLRLRKAYQRRILR